MNPYGVAVVPASGGRLTAGDILVSNFNDKANVQGTGTTLVEVSPAGKASVFANISALRRPVLPGRHRADHGAGHPARWLGGGGQPADHVTAACCPP